MSERFIAVDWGTTSRRVYLIEGDAVISTERDDLGAASMASGGYEEGISAIRARLADLPMLLAGMVGSDIGWHKVAYVSAPASLPDLAAALEWMDDRTAIVPGIAYRDAERVDVMRGEEVLLLGAAAAGMVPSDALLCQPGTHCKWATLESGSIVSFITAMTGELFALLSTSGLLARQLAGEVLLGPSFLAGVAEGARRDLAASLFSVRSRGLLGTLDAADAASFASGMLIGADVAAHIEPGAAVFVVAEEALGQLYAAAIEQLGGVPRRVDSQAAFVAGMKRLKELAS